MPAYVITGKLGAGKSLVAVARIFDYLHAGRKVATNMTLYPENLAGYWSKNTTIYRLPNKPTVDDLNALPLGHDEEKPNDDMNGALVLDECGTWFNSRTWNEKGRADLIEWFRNARKNRWDLFFIIQDISVMDTQARESFAEFVVYCRRFDRFNIPILKHFGIKPPKLHLGVVKYGASESATTVDQWMYRGHRFYSSYDTEQVFTGNTEIVAISTVLNGYLTHGRYTTKIDYLKQLYNSRKIPKSWFFLAGVLASFFLVNTLMTVTPQTPKKGIWSCNDAYKELYGSCDAKPVIKPTNEAAPLPDDSTSNQTAHAKNNPVQTPTPDNSIRLHFSGYIVSSDGAISVNFTDATGNPVIVPSYNVVAYSDCAIQVLINDKPQVVTCLDFSYRYSTAKAN